VLAAEHHLEFLALQFGPCGSERGLRLAGGLGIFGALLCRHREKQPRLVEAGAQALAGGELIPDLVLLLRNRLSGVGAIPEIKLGGLLVEFVEARGQASDVKDASRSSRRVDPSRSVPGEGRLASEVPHYHYSVTPGLGNELCPSTSPIVWERVW